MVERGVAKFYWLRKSCFLLRLLHNITCAVAVRRESLASGSAHRSIETSVFRANAVSLIDSRSYPAALILTGDA